MRPPTACVACRSRRRKCEVTNPNERCVYCAKRDVPCSFELPAGIPTGLWNDGPTSPTSSDHGLKRWQTPSTSLPPRQTCIDVTKLYFQYIHDTFHSLFHPPSVIKEVEDGTIPKILLLGIISLAARFSNDSFFANIDPRARGRPYAHEAEQLLNLREISLTTIQAAVIIGCFCVTEGDPEAEGIYYTVACRNALILDLPNLPAQSRVAQETQRRIWWTLNMIETWSSNGLGLPRNIHPRESVPFPMEETVFLELRAQDSELPSPSAMEESTASLLTQMVKLNGLLVEITNLNSFAASTPNSTYNISYRDTVDALTNKLESWYNNLPLQLQDTHANLTRYAELGLGGVFVAVYLGYYHYGQSLYYAYLHEDIYTTASFPTHEVDPQLMLPEQQAHYYADKCRQHSTALLELLYRAYSTPGCDVLYTMVGHVLVIASTVQLHILLFSPSEPAIRAARSRLEKNFEILTRLQGYWPTLDVCFVRFREFHKACQKSKETSFRLDRWMLQFLLAFAKPPVGEKGETMDETEMEHSKMWSMSDLGFSPYN
jgi:hypothetical protein